MPSTMPGESHRRERGGGDRSHPASVSGLARSRLPLGGAGRFLLVTLIGAIGAGCRGAPEATPGNGTPEDQAAGSADDVVTDAAADSLRLDLDVPARVTAGDPVPMTLRVENVAERPVDLYLTGRTIAFDLIVEDEAGTVVWRRLHDQVVEQILRVEQLASGDTLVLEDTWNQRSNDGAPVAPGGYTVRAEVLTEDEPLVAGPEPLRIVGG